MDKILLTVADGVATVTINRPERHNALDTGANHQLHEALTAADSTPGVVAIVLEGAGEKAFCAGADIKEMPKSEVAEGEERFSFGGGLTGVGGALLNLTRPTIAVVRGWALGGGFELAAACDIVIAADDAQFGIPEANIGILGDSLVVHRAMRQLPYHVALDLILTGRNMSGAEAAKLGLVSAAAPSVEIDRLLNERLELLRASSPSAVRASRAVALEGLELSLSQALGRIYPCVEEHIAGADYKEALAAISERRTPIWEPS